MRSTASLARQEAGVLRRPPHGEVFSVVGRARDVNSDQPPNMEIERIAVSVVPFGRYDGCNGCTGRIVQLGDSVGHSLSDNSQEATDARNLADIASSYRHRVGTFLPTRDRLRRAGARQHLASMAWSTPRRYGRRAGLAAESLRGALKPAWQVDLGPGYPGPIVAADRVFVAETQDQKNEVVRALDRSTGRELWSAVMARCDVGAVHGKAQRRLDSLDAGLRRPVALRGGDARRLGVPRCPDGQTAMAV